MDEGARVDGAVDAGESSAEAGESPETSALDAGAACPMVDAAECPSTDASAYDCTDDSGVNPPPYTPAPPHVCQFELYRDGAAHGIWCCR